MNRIAAACLILCLGICIACLTQVRAQDPEDAQTDEGDASSPRPQTHDRSKTDREALYYLKQGKALLAKGQAAAASRRFGRALALYRSAGQQRPTATVLFYMGMAEHAAGNPESAARMLAESAAFQQKLGDPGAEAAARYQHGRVEQGLGRLGEAEADEREAARLWSSAGRPEDRAAALNALGLLLDVQGRHAAASTTFEKALELVEGQGLPLLTAQILDNLAMAAHANGESERADANLVKAVGLQRPLKQPQVLAGILTDQAIVRQALGRFPESMAAFKEAQQIVEHGGSREALVRVLAGIGELLAAWGQGEHAIVYLQRARLLLAKGKDRRGLATVYERLADLYQRSGNVDRTREYLAAAAQAWQEAGDVTAQARVLALAGAASRTASDPARAQSLLDQALALQRKLGAHADAAQTLYQLALVDLDRGDRQMAIDRLQEARTIQEAGLPSKELSDTLLLIGRTLAQGAEEDEAIDVLQKARRLKEKFQDRRGLAAVLALEGDVSVRQKADVAALDAYRRALEIRQTVGPTSEVASLHDAMGSVLTRLRDLAGARGHFVEALAEHRRAQADPLVAGTLDRLARIDARCGNLADAMREFGEALRILQRLNLQAPLGQVLHHLGLALESGGRLAEASDVLDQALALDLEGGVGGGGGAQAETDAVRVALGRVLAVRGELERARSLGQDAQRSCEKARDGAGVAQALALQATVAYRRGDLDRAVFDADRARALAEREGSDDTREQALLISGVAHLDRHEIAAAEEDLRSAAQVAIKLKDDAGLAQARVGLARTSTEQHALEASRQFLAKARAIVKTGEISDAAAAIAQAEAQLALARGRRDEALARLTEAVEIRARLGDPWRLALALREKAGTLAAGGDLAGARAAYEESAHAVVSTWYASEYVLSILSASWLALRSGDVGAAQDLALRAQIVATRAHTPGTARALIVRGIADLQEGRGDAARVPLLAALQQTSDPVPGEERARALLALASIAMDAGSPSRALEAARDAARALARGPDGHAGDSYLQGLAGVWRGRAWLAMARGRGRGEAIALIEGTRALIMARGLLARANPPLGGLLAFELGGRDCATLAREGALRLASVPDHARPPGRLAVDLIERGLARPRAPRRRSSAAPRVLRRVVPPGAALGLSHQGSTDSVLGSVAPVGSGP